MINGIAFSILKHALPFEYSVTVLNGERQETSILYLKPRMMVKQVNKAANLCKKLIGFFDVLEIQLTKLGIVNISISYSTSV